MTKRIDQKQVRLALARKVFFDFCHLLAPDFYQPSRQYLVDLCDDLQRFLEDDTHDVLIINEPPRHGKSRTAGMFVQWVLGRDSTKKIMTGSYNETLSTVFSKNVRNAIQEVKADEGVFVYADVFPKTSIKHGDGAMNLWSLEGGYNNYLATSPSGTATGFGADIMIIDDLIKSAVEANNARILQEHWEWFTNTMLSRLESGGKIIIIMTRWHSNDLAGRALAELPGMGYRIQHISMKAYDEETDTMLCDEVLTKAEYQRKVQAMGAHIAAANYNQEPIDLKGSLYGELKTYSERVTFTQIKAYIDTADAGSDYLAGFVYGETANKEAYILDVIYTQEPMEVTEPLTAKMLYANRVDVCYIESNNGGGGFARSVEGILNRDYFTNKTVIKTFHQSQNKVARILSNATWVQEHVYFPEGWHYRWAKLYDALMTYQREGKNAHDDAPDALTGVAEKMNEGKGWLY